MKKLSWDDIEKMTDDLANTIQASGFVPDYCIGITTGGLIPLYFLAKKLDVDNILTVSATSYTGETKGDLHITYLPEIDLTGKKLLIVDEIAETGDTLKNVSQAITEKYIPDSIKTVALVVNTKKCTTRPDFYGKEDASEWLLFPWEKHDFPEYFER
jgi:hypoxanthine phosphoribosyltransferase